MMHPFLFNNFGKNILLISVEIKSLAVSGGREQLSLTSSEAHC